MWWTLKRYVHVQTLGTVNISKYLFGKWVFAGVIKLNSWISLVGPKPNDKCPSKSEAEHNYVQ